MLPRHLDTKGMALHFLQEVRNEAHRFAIAYNRLLRSKKMADDATGIRKSARIVSRLKNSP
jgi:excinuclease ABC subunit C